MRTLSPKWERIVVRVDTLFALLAMILLWFGPLGYFPAAALLKNFAWQKMEIVRRLAPSCAARMDARVVTC